MPCCYRPYLSWLDHCFTGYLQYLYFFKRPSERFLLPSIKLKSIAHYHQLIEWTTLTLYLEKMSTPFLLQFYTRWKKGKNIKKSWIIGSYLVYSFLALLNRDEAVLLTYARRKKRIAWAISFLLLQKIPGLFIPYVLEEKWKYWMSMPLS